jgi:hypothetical protein
MIAFEMSKTTEVRDGKPERRLPARRRAPHEPSCDRWGRRRRGIWRSAALALTLVLIEPACVAQAAGRAQQSNGEVYARSVRLVESPTLREACVPLDAQVMEHAAPGLEDLVLMADGRPEHFALTLSSAQGGKSEAAAIENFTSAAGSTSFDLKMPVKTYDAVTLDLRAANFVTTAEVTASDAPRCNCPQDAAATELGEFVIFDLNRSRYRKVGSEVMPRETTLRFAETAATYLHVTLRRQFSRSDLDGATVPPMRAAAVPFTTVAETRNITQLAGKTVATLDVPGGIPLERVQIDVAGNAPAFRRAVAVEAAPSAAGMRDPAYMESFDGYIQQIHESSAGQVLDVKQTSLDSVLVTNQNGPARISVTIDNAGEPPLPIESVKLQMRRRSVCFQAQPGVSHWELYYGGAVPEAGDAGRTLIEAKNSITAELGAEQMVRGPVTTTELSWEERHPAVRWIFGAVLLLCILALMLRGMRRLSGHR